MGVEVPTEVYEGLERVRESGLTNIFDRKAVQFYANENEDYATVVWIEDHAGLYARGIFSGFEPTDSQEAWNPRPCPCGHPEMTRNDCVGECGFPPYSGPRER